jgi:putative ABC transport system permease protein
VPKVAEDAAVIPISVEDRVMERLGIGIGAELEFQAQGLALKTVVASTRDILWERLERNSIVVFPEGVLEAVPQYRVLSLRVEGQEKASALAQRISASYPNVSLVDTASIIETVTKILHTIEQAISFLSLFLLGSGVLVFASSVIGSAQPRLREGELLKTLGATRRIVRQLIVTEYSALALVALLAATPLSLLCGWGLARFVFKVPVSAPDSFFWGVTALIFVLTVAVAQLLGWLARPLERARQAD